MEQLKALWADLQARYQALTERERTLVLGAGGALSAFALFLIIFSFSSSATATQRRIDSKLKKLHEVQELADTYRDADRARQDVEQSLSGSGLQLISYIEEKGTNAGLDIPAMNPKGDVALGDGKIVESSVELTFTDVPLRKLYEFLSAVERGPGVVKVKFLRIEPRIANETVTAWTTIATYKMKQP